MVHRHTLADLHVRMYGTAEPVVKEFEVVFDLALVTQDGVKREEVDGFEELRERHVSRAIRLGAQIPDASRQNDVLGTAEEPAHVHAQPFAISASRIVR